MALVGWDTICQPRARGGLGLRQLNDQNSSFFMKIGFSLGMGPMFAAGKILGFQVPEEVINRITSNPPPHPNSGADIVIWARLATGFFSVRNAYWSLKENTWHPHEEYWKIPWKYPGPQLLTNSECGRRGICHSSSCHICGHGFEDLEHVLRDCPAAKEVWMIVLPNQLKQRRLQGSGLT
ncbi:Non-LTR retroelement reverse transcriptase [Gossypium australe]|uniref:Non-LTR retroelement reverse transcriptase n=1 Tax=Gossypium australe TaxID=47621 RepID=A0A5B6VVC1_9ROSI|nr:Non-LTR retroelement reverse transcriptase [Gossypium australe]